MRRWAAAHFDTLADSSAYTATDLDNDIFVSVEKHASYVSEQACDDGALYSDFCRSELGFRPAFENAGEQYLHDPFDWRGAVVEYPGVTPTTEAGYNNDWYYMWNTAGFGSAGAYARQLNNRFLNWATFQTYIWGRPPSTGAP